MDLSAQYIVTHNLAPVMSTSFGLCEAWLGSSGNNFLNSLWQQAAAQGITVFVSSGDNGAAGCDSASASNATYGRAVNGLCSTPYSVCVGGTEFNDASNASLYWTTSNASGTQASAISYIPEVVWNESGPGAGLWASGGGASTIYAKPNWQTGTGVPADGKRDVPDVSLSAAGHDGYLIVQNGGFYVVGGTSAASPSFAGVMALVVQNTAARQGNANTAFYPLASRQRAGGASVFHDVTSGSNSVPGQPGFNATTGYDQATGLGPIDASALVNHWSDSSVVPAFQAALSANSLAVDAGSNNSVIRECDGEWRLQCVRYFFSDRTAHRSYSRFYSRDVLGAGFRQRHSQDHGGKQCRSAGRFLGYRGCDRRRHHAKTHSVTERSRDFSLTPTFILAPSATSIKVAAGTSQTLTLTTTPNSTFNAAITFTATGLPFGCNGSASAREAWNLLRAREPSH